MTSKTLYKAGWLWQDYTGAKWQNLSWANTGDNHASYVYPQGKGSKSAYRPKSLFYHYQVTGIDTDKYQLDSVKFVLVFGKLNTKSNSIPSIKVFYGDNNAPYKKTPLYTTSSYTSLKNKYDFDSHTVQYTIKGVTLSQLRNIIIEVDWGRTKISGSSTISINRARLNVAYSRKTPKFSLYDDLDLGKIYTTNDKIAWRITVKNTGACGSGKVAFNLPKGINLTSPTGTGSYNATTKVWSYSNLCNGKTFSRTFYIQSKLAGVVKNIEAINNSPYATNLNIIRQVSFAPYIEPYVPYIPEQEDRDDIITYTFYKETYAKEENQFFDVHIQGMKENHPYGFACFEINPSNNIRLNTPVRTYVELLDDNRNIKEIVRDSSTDYEHIHIDISDETVCFKLDDIEEDFVANIRVYMYCLNDEDGTITINANGIEYSDTFEIMPMRTVQMFTEYVPSRDKQYVQTSINIGVPNIWTLRAKSSKYNFFDEKKSDFAISIEKLIAYIGCVPLKRGHKADERANTTNTKIDNTYLNRRYLGKAGDTREEIPMTLRLHWTDIATLQGLVALDKPIPIDTCPELPDGDPVNHRGWAELTAIKNIRKINEMIYECQPEVDYLTHSLLTMFAIEDKGNMTTNTLEYFLAETHTVNDNILEKFNISYGQFWTNLEDEQGNIVGTYELEPSTDFYLNSIESLKDYCKYDIKFRNTLPALMSEDYDKNWEMAIRVLDKKSRKPLFEHKYNNFKHYDFSTGTVLNQADVSSKVLQGENYNVLNFDNMVLGYDSLAPLLEDNKETTHFNTLEDTVIDESNTYIEMFLLNKNNEGLPNQKVEVIISDNEEYVEMFNLITDIYGRFKINTYLANGTYNIECNFYETEGYRSCTYSDEFSVQFDVINTSFNYYEDFITYVNDSSYEAILVDEENNPLPNEMVYYSFRDLSSETYGHEEAVLTDANGKALIPIVNNNGSKDLKVAFKGTTVYAPCFFETIVDINIQGKTTIIESDDVELVQGDAGRIYNIILKDSNDVFLKNKPVDICFYRQDESYVISTTTNEYGVANAPIYLNKGAWKVDAVFKGDEEYKPVVSTNDILIKEYIQLDTHILSENIILDESEIISGNQNYYTLTLLDKNDNPVKNEPMNILIYNNDKSERYVNVILKTDENGQLEVPFVSHGETVIVESYYYGCNQYKPTFKFERVSFEENVIKEDVTIYVNEDLSDPENISREIFLKEGEVDGHILYEIFDGRYDIILNYPENNRVSNKGANYLASLNEGVFNVTVIYYGTDNYYPTMVTLEYDHPNDTRYPLEGGMVDFSDLVNLQGLDNTYDYEYELEESYEVGALSHLRIYCDYDLPDSHLVIGGGYHSSSLSIVTEIQVKLASDYMLTTIPHTWYSELGAKRSYIDFDFIVPQNGKLLIFVPQTDFTPAIPLLIELNVVSTDKESTTITENGFGIGNKTYQDIFISTDNPTAPSNALLNEYFLAKLVNKNTLEELFYYSYLSNKDSIAELKFLLEKGQWTLELLTKESESYNGAVLIETATLDVTTTYENNSLDLLFNNTKWNDKGELNISDCLDDTTDTIETTSDSELLYSVLNTEFTTSNNYVFSFDYTYRYRPDYANLFFGINIDVEDDYDGVWVALDRIFEYKDNEVINTVTLAPKMEESKIRVTIERKGNIFIIYFDGKQVYLTKNATYNNLGIYIQGQGASIKIDNFEFKDSERIVEIINPATTGNENLNNEVFGSDVHLEIKKNKLNLIDYGMLPQGEVGAGKIILSDIPLPDVDYELEIWVNYANTRFERLNNLEGLMQMSIYEDVLTSESALKYNVIQCSPVPVPNSITQFTRVCDEGTMYYIEKPKNGTAKYLCNPYIQYKGGVDLKTETGISIFNLDNAFSPVMLSNGLVRAEFHRRSGYIVISKFDENTENWYKCNIFKLANQPNLYLDEDYSDDKATVRFGNTKWTMWRGRPFIKLEHKEDDLRILDLVDRVFCETEENEFNMGFVEDYDDYMSIFNPQTSIQKFQQDLHIGQNIKLDNFQLVNVDENNNEYDLVTDAELTTVMENDDVAIKITKNEGGDVGLNFPLSPNYVKKPANTFSLLLGYVMNHNEDEIIVKARGYDDKGKIPVKEELQYGIWESSQTIQLADSGERDEIRVTFTDVPSDVKYVDFILIFGSNEESDITINQIMLYEGDSTINHDVDTSQANASLVEITFNESYYACLYDEDSPSGLCIVRPNKKKFTLRKLEASEETILIPYMKKYAEYDAVENIMLEYFNSKNQVINVDWEG